MTDYSTDWYESGGENTDSEYSTGGDSWQEYYDESAQAKYWYNAASVNNIIYFILKLNIYFYILYFAV